MATRIESSSAVREFIRQQVLQQWATEHGRAMDSLAPLASVEEVSKDPHCLARFTAKFAIPKGYHTLRNKHMKLEKLTYSFGLKTRRLLSMVAGPGDQSLYLCQRQNPAKAAGATPVRLRAPTILTRP